MIYILECTRWLCNQDFLLAFCMRSLQHLFFHHRLRSSLACVSIQDRSSDAVHFLNRSGPNSSYLGQAADREPLCFSFSFRGPLCLCTLMNHLKVGCVGRILSLSFCSTAVNLPSAWQFSRACSNPHMPESHRQHVSPITTACLSCTIWQLWEKKTLSCLWERIWIIYNFVCLVMPSVWGF